MTAVPNLPKHATGLKVVDCSDHRSCANSQQTGDPFETGIALSGFTIEMFDQRSCNAPIVFLQPGCKADGLES
jgi:hypothetical protein